MTGTDKKKFVPLIKIVKSAIVDSYEDIGKTQELFLHWAARGFNKLQREVLKQGKRYAFLEVSQNTHTATLPLDFEEELFVGVVGANGMKLPLRSNDNLINRHNVEVDNTLERCRVCNQPTGVCEDLQITETSNLIVINDETYEQKIIKKLYPNGDYYLETTTPYYDQATDTVVYNTDKEFIDHLNLKPCGCIEETSSNLTTLQKVCPDAYCCYFTGCDSCCADDFGTYRIFEESSLIQFDYNFKFDKVYIEYIGSMPKIKGQLQVPAVAFETLVEWTKYKSIQNRKNVSRIERDQYFRSYERERRNMEKVLAPISLSFIVDAATRVPKFNVSYQDSWCGWFDWSAQKAAAVPAASVPAAPTTPTGGGTTTIINNNYITDSPKGIIVKGNELSSENSYLASSLAGFDIWIFYNGVRYLKTTEYTVGADGMVTILLPQEFTEDDEFLLIPNGKR